MITAELAAALPVLMIVLAVAVSAVSIAGTRVRVHDAAREAARAAARGDPATGTRLAQAAAPGVRVEVSRSGGDVVVVAQVRVHPLAQWLPAVTVSERVVAAAEPGEAP